MMIRLSALQQKLLLGCAVAGLVVPNGLFLYYVFVDFSVVVAAHRNPVAAAFIGEAIFLMVFFTWILKQQMPRSRNWLGFLAASIVGSLAFSVPLFVYRMSRGSAPSRPVAGR